MEERPIRKKPEQLRLKAPDLDVQMFAGGHKGDDPRYSELWQQVKHWRRLYRQEKDKQAKAWGRLYNLADEYHEGRRGILHEMLEMLENEGCGPGGERE